MPLILPAGFPAKLEYVQEEGGEAKTALSTKTHDIYIRNPKGT